MLPSNASIAFDGNSLTAGAGTPEPLIYYVLESLGDRLNGARYLKNGNYQTAGVSGQAWEDMSAAHADVDNFWDPARVNCLIVSEDTNAIHQAPARSAAETIADAKAYFDTMWAVHPGWKILMWGNIPRTSTAPEAAALIEVNDYWRDNWEAEGLAGWIDMRETIPQYNHDGTSSAYFTPFASAWSETFAPYVHPSVGSYEDNTGTRAIAARIVEGLLAIDWTG